MEENGTYDECEILLFHNETKAWEGGGVRERAKEAKNTIMRIK